MIIRDGPVVGWLLPDHKGMLLQALSRGIAFGVDGRGVVGVPMLTR